MTCNFKLTELAVFFIATIVLGVQIGQLVNAYRTSGSISTFECSIGLMALAIAGSIFHRVRSRSTELDTAL
jgi:hypothetical protein